LAKDAGDVYRLFDAIAPDEMAAILTELLADERSRATTAKSLTYFDELFANGSSVGVHLAVEALRTLLPEEAVTAAMTASATELRRSI
jgi:hypothetical protein